LIFRKLSTSASNAAVVCDANTTGLDFDGNDVYNWTGGMKVCGRAVSNTARESRVLRLEDYNKSLGYADTLSDFMARASSRGVKAWNPSFGAPAILSFYGLD
jgi:hypothetical protein